MPSVPSLARLARVQVEYLAGTRTRSAARHASGQIQRLVPSECRLPEAHRLFEPRGTAVGYAPIAAVPAPTNGWHRSEA